MRMPMFDCHAVFFVPSMSRRRNSWPLSGLQMKRVMSRSRSTPMILRS
uniref:Uncharacterized protein n=1 Tax=Arundo donax TaxID=35708 RepID=A0A0A9AV79_ARUDO